MAQSSYERIQLKEGEALHIEHVALKDINDYKSLTHFHEVHEIVLFENVTGSVWIDGVDHPLNGQALVYIAPNSMHRFTLEKGTSTWHLFQFDQILLDQLGGFDQLFNSSNTSHLDGSTFKRLQLLFSWYLEVRNESTQREYALNILRLLISWVNSQGQSSHSKNARSSKFRPLLEFLENHRKYHISVEEAASLVGLSPSHFLALFKKHFSITFNNFLLTRKMNAASFLLKESDKSITEIAQLLEFSDSNYFARIFKKYHGVTAREFRK